MNGPAIACTCTAILALTASATAAERHVPSAYSTIQAAIAAARPGDTVIVADGVYTGPGNRDITFAGKAITVRSANGAATCIIDCQGTQEDPHRGFHFAGGETSTSVLDGFTIRNGSTPPGAVLNEFNGAGILCEDGSPTIKNCVLTDNWAGCWGAAICCGWNSESSPIIMNCTITGNYSNDDGGAIFSFDGSPTIINSLIVGNEARVRGGGINHFGTGTVTIRNSTIAGNIAPLGSGVFEFTGSVNISNSIVRGNAGGAQISGTPAVTYSNVEGGFDGVGNVDVDPSFVDPSNGDHRLAAGSPMIDAGDPSFSAGAGETDLDGDPRVVGTQVDIGADEMLRAGDVNIDGAVNVLDLIVLLLQFGTSGPEADLNDDGVVNVLDLVTLLLDFG